MKKLKSLLGSNKKEIEKVKEKNKKICPKCNSDQIKQSYRYSTDTNTGGVSVCKNCDFVGDDSKFF